MEDGPPPFSSLFGGDDEDCDEAADDAHDYKYTDTSAADQIKVEMIDESNLQAVTHRIGKHLPCVIDPSASNIDEQAYSAAHAIAELHYRIELIQRHMGSLALCRGSRGDALYEAGAVDVALGVLAGLNRDLDCGCTSSRRTGMQSSDELECGELCAVATDTVRLPIIKHEDEVEAPSENTAIYQSTWSEVDQAAVALASACLGAIRDLACGNASNRAAVSEYTITCCEHCICGNESGSGPQILASYIRRYHGIYWEDIIILPGDIETATAATDTSTQNTARGKKELRLFTDATGAIRNASHSTPRTCSELHAASVTEMFIWRLKYGSKEDSVDCNRNMNGDDAGVLPSLPDASRPWREASFRIAGSLINMSERCSDSAKLCGTDLALLQLLVEAWGGAGSGSSKKQTSASTPMLHLGLAAILHAADNHLRSIGQDGLNAGLRLILDKEEARKRFAQKQEAERQKRIARGLK